MENNITTQSGSVRPAKTGPMWQESADYFGALVLHGPARFAVSPNGKRYLWQVSSGDGDFERFGVKNWRKKLSLLLPDLPVEVADYVSTRFPENSSDFERPWASLISGVSGRVKSTRYNNDIYGGVIACFDDLRLVFIASPDRFCLQVRGASGSWIGVASNAFSKPLVGLVSSDIPSDHKVAPFVGVSLFVDALSALSDRASDYSGSRPDNFKDAFGGPVRALARSLVVSPPVRLAFSAAVPAASSDYWPPLGRAGSRADRHAACKARRDASAARRSRSVR